MRGGEGGREEAKGTTERRVGVAIRTGVHCEVRSARPEEGVGNGGVDQT